MKTFIVKVVSAKSPHTVVVEKEQIKVHPLYGKRMRRIKRMKAHVENLEVAMGDMVKIRESKPISKEKHFIVTEVITIKSKRVV